MTHKEVLNLLTTASDSRYMTTKWNIVNDQSNSSHSVGNKIFYYYQQSIIIINLCICVDA